MKELDFKKVVVSDCKCYLSEHLDDDEIYRNVLSCSADALDSILGLDFNFSAIHDMLTFYLLNSKQPNEIKNHNAECMCNFVYAAQNISRNSTQLNVLNKALFEMAED